jgi:hypothetical protein
MTDKQKNIIKYSLAGIVGLNLLMCLNLYRQIGEIEYKVYSMDGDAMSAIQSLSNDVWQMKSGKANDSRNYSGGFE